MKQKKAYKYRFYPTDEQKQVLARTFGCCRFVYNWALRQKTDAFYNKQQRLYYKDLSAMLPTLKQRYQWLGEVASVPLQQVLRHLDKAFINFFEGRGEYPKFKKRRNQQSATYVGTANVGSRLLVASLLELGVLATSLEEIDECFIKMAQDLLQWNRGDFTKPLIALFQCRKHSTQVFIVEALLLVVERIRLLAQGPIVDEAATPECTSQHLLLLV